MDCVVVFAVFAQFVLLGVSENNTAEALINEHW